MKYYVSRHDHGIELRYNDEIILIEPYGPHTIRFRMTKMVDMPEKNWTLEPPKPCNAQYEITDDKIQIINGNITCHISKYGVISYLDKEGKLLLKEQHQDRTDPSSHMALNYGAREIKPILGGMYSATFRFESYEDEKLYGMGQRQIPHLDIKGCTFELAQRNSQANIPFVLSNRGYGFFWNNPGIGEVMFAKNHTEWRAQNTSVVDYFITAGDSPQAIIDQYSDLVGKPSEFPLWAAGFWQCKLRYKTQEELLNVAREHKRRGLPLSVIIIDFFHWVHQGDWSFDKKYWPDPKAMVEELESMGIKLMVSIWPTVDTRSENYEELKAKGFLIRTDAGTRTQKTCLGACIYFDATNPGARDYIWNKAKENYYEFGIDAFWLDEAEPEYNRYDFELYRHYLGSSQEVGNIYPTMYAKAFYDGLKEEGVQAPLSLVRCAWAGSQKYGALLWSGDIYSDFRTLRIQLTAGLNAGMSGIPWWTTDIGGFQGGHPDNPRFRELVIRWFQFGVFCPVFRLHGFRLPAGDSAFSVDSGLFDFETCGENEVWSYGEEAYDIITELLFLRERMKDYIMQHMDRASQTGAPIMRPLFFDFPKDESCWQVEDQYMFGDALLIAPILYEGHDERAVYLPGGETWIDVHTGKSYEGGQTITHHAPLDTIPVFTKDKSLLSIFQPTKDS